MTARLEENTASTRNRSQGSVPLSQPPSSKLQGIGLVLVLVLLIAATLFLTFRSTPSPPSTRASIEEGVMLQFGLSRSSVTRSLRLDLCPEANPGPYVECTQANQENPRPEVASVSLQSDLVNPATGEQFPIGQFTISAANVGRTGLLVSVGANPSEPEDVPAGSYVGQVLIDRVGDRAPIRLNVEASLANRGDWKVVSRVLLALILGAYAGTLLKWLDESFSPLATLRRRQRRVEQYLRHYIPGLPVAVVSRLRDVDSAIRSFDADGVGARLDDIANNQDALVAFASANVLLEEQLQKQRTELSTVAKEIPDVRSAMDVEAERLRELRTEVWPWEAADEVKPRLEKLKRQSRDLTVAMRRVTFPHEESDRSRLIAVAREILSDDRPRSDEKRPETAALEVAKELRPPIGSRDGVSSALDTTPPDASAITAAPRRSVGLWLLDNAWWLVLAITAAVVVFLGYQTQFLTNLNFEGDAVDYFGLTAWALAIQVAGGTILETMGKLRTTRNVA